MTQAEALTILKTGANIFLTGEPGTGKSHIVNEYVAWLTSCGIEPAVTAATGIAATNIRGMTLHSWSGIGVTEKLSRAEVDRIAQKEHVARRIQRARILIIDEVSMLSATTFMLADAVCREVRRNDSPFGGMQVVLVGDFFQLPPVSRNREAQFAYDSTSWQELNPIVCYLSEQYRQDDPAFLDVLTAIRRNDVEELHYEQLKTRYMKAEHAPADIPVLYSHNADVDRMNSAALEKLPGGTKRYEMTHKGSPVLVEALKRGCLSPETMVLKPGAAVMFTKNSPQGRFVNGTVGTVVDFEAVSGLPIVETVDGDHITADRMEWQVEENGKVRASITQVPLRLAWAITVHKSQGQSLDAAVMDLSQAFEYGQGYVALSRVRRLSGLYLLGLNQKALQVHPEILNKDIEFRELSAAAMATFSGMPESEVTTMQKRFVAAIGGAWPTEGVARPKKKKGNRWTETLEAVREAKTLPETAKARGLTIGTVLTHLEGLKAEGKLDRSDFRHLLPDERTRREIEDAFEATGGERLTPTFKALKGRYDFETLRLVRLTMQTKAAP